MAKKKAKSKLDVTKIVLAVVVLALAVLTICTLFMPTFRSFVEALGKTKEVGKITGADVFTSAFHSELNADLSSGANSMIALKMADDTAFVTGAFSWLYVIAIVMSVVAIVFTVLSLIGLRLKLANTILGIAFAVVSILAFIFAIVVAGKMINYSGYVGSAKTVISTASYLMFAGVIAGATQVILARRK